MNHRLFANSSFGLALRFLAFALLLSNVTLARAATSFDIGRDFSKTSNPSGVWTLGWKSNLTSSLVEFPIRGTVPADNGVPIDYWQGVPLDEPTIYHNGTTNFAISNGGSGGQPPGTTLLFAGPNGSGRNFGVIRFTAPTSASFELETSVGPYLTSPPQGDTDFHVLHNAVEIFGRNLASGATATFSDILTLSAGDTVDFAIGRGADDDSYASGLLITATLSLGASNPPVIIIPPSSQTAQQGSTATFSVAAVGTPPLGYQWRFNDVDISGATNSTLTLANVQPANAGNYSVVVANNFGAVTSAVAVLTVRSQAATSFDIGRDFSKTSNPSGVWSLGWKSNLASSLVVFPIRGTVPADNGVPIDYWQGVPLDEPTIYHNGTTNFAGSNGGSGGQPPGTTLLFAGPNGSGRNFGVIRFTAPTSASFELETSVGPYLTSPPQGDTDFHVLHNAVEIFGRNLASGAAATFSDILTLSAGDTVDFAIGRGEDDNNYASGLLITATLSLGASNPPIVITPPRSLAVQQGSNATFSVAAVGTPPLGYQWRFNDEDISGATSSALTLPNVQVADAGNYSVVVANNFGAVTSAVALLTVTLPPSTVRLASANVAGGGQVQVPVKLVAQGNEAALGFSLNFDTDLLALDSVTLGAEAPAGATLIVNDTQAEAGRVGLGVALPAGSAFALGTLEIVVVQFTAAALINAETTRITFEDVPTARQLSDRQAVSLPAIFEGGTVSISAVDFEGDVASRPNGDRALNILDWVQVGRFVAALDTVSSPAEFQRADCAPRVTRGNGNISVTDYVQAGRYAVGLDPLTPAGGPTSEENLGERGGGFEPASEGRTLRLLNASIAQGQTSLVPAVLEATGNENALGFSVAFDPLKLGYVGVVNGAGAAGASITVNPSQQNAGRLGIVFALPPGSALAARRQELVLVQFLALAPASSTTTVSFADNPVARETSDPLANALNTTYTSGTISVTPSPGPPLRLTRSGNNLLISWPSSAKGFELEATAGALGTGWSPVPGVLDLGEQQLAIVTATGSQRYFRLKKP